MAKCVNLYIFVEYVFKYRGYMEHKSDNGFLVSGPNAK